MRCWEARRKLTESLKTGSGIAHEAALTEHLQHCPDCAAQAAAWRAVRNDLTAAAAPDLTETVPLEILRRRVEREAAGADLRRSREKSVMAALFNTIRTRPRYGLGLTALVAVLALSILIPLKYDRSTVGYEVALAGVDKELAMNTEKMNEFLVQLGVTGAGVTVGDCDQTCKIKITRLKSQDDAKLVMAAFGGVIKFDLQASAYEIMSCDTGQTIKFICNLDSLEADNMVFCDSIQKIVIERCGADFDGQNMIWVALDTSGESSLQLGDGIITIKRGEQFNLSPAEIAELEASGLTVKQLDSDGHTMFMICDTTCVPGCDSMKWFQVQDSAAAKTDPTLPEGYILEQNYPNPFNPNTTISFTLPSVQQVKLQVFNVQGQLVKTLIDDEMDAGSHAVEWHATDDTGAPVASGIYLYRLTTEQGSATKKMSLVK